MMNYIEILNGKILEGYEQAIVSAPFWKDVPLTTFIKEWEVLKSKYELQVHQRWVVSEDYAHAILCMVESPTMASFPLVLVFDEVEATPQIRIYHSTWVFTHEHIVRAPLVDVPNTVLPTLPLPLIEYFDGLAKGNVEKMLDTMEDEVFFMQPAGADYQTKGKQAVKQSLHEILVDGGVICEDVRIIGSERTFFIEHNMVPERYPTQPKQAGVAIYHFHKDGLIEEIIVVDDYHIIK